MTARSEPPPAAEPEPRVAVAEQPPPREEGPIDVFECDHYVEAYRECIAGMSDEERAAHTAVVDGQRAAWAKARRDPKLADALAEACATATAAARVALPRCRGW